MRVEDAKVKNGEKNISDLFNLLNSTKEALQRVSSEIADNYREKRERLNRRDLQKTKMEESEWKIRNM